MADAVDVKLSADVGGTFTDIVLEQEGRRWTTKVLTTPAAPEEGVLRGISEMLKVARVRLEDVDFFAHGTTLATNAIIERRGAKTALLATSGFRDILEIASESRYDQYELALVKPVHLVNRPQRFTVTERMDARGNVLVALDESALQEIAAELIAQGIESLAIAFMHSYMNSAHERRAAELLRRMVPGLYVSISSEVCPEIREYERTSTTVVSAYIQPLIDGYLARMTARLDEMGFTGTLCLMSSGGGLTSVETARAFPVRLVESGPAGGAVFAAQIAARLGEPRVIAFDMGGTTAKASLIEDFEPKVSRFFEVDRAARFLKGSGLPLRIPCIEMVEIGAGGGSLARIDSLDRVAVGPESASSVPGPVCYDSGGTVPTVTDADLTLGLIDPNAFAGGTIRLRPDLSAQALAEQIGAPLSLSPEMAAYAVYEMVCENMASAIRVHAVERGTTTGSHTLIAFGGAAPLHVARVAEKIGVSRVIIPTNAGVGSAVGFLSAPISYEVVKTQHMTLDTMDFATASTLLTSAAAEIMAWVKPAAHGQAITERRIAFMRYVGQGHEIAVDLPLRDLTAADIAGLREHYEVTYQKLFNRSIPQSNIEILAWSVRCSTIVPKPDEVGQTPASGQKPPSESVRIFDGKSERWIEVRRYKREGLQPGARFEGPAIVVERETTTFITDSFDGRIDTVGSIVLDRKEPKP